MPFTVQEIVDGITEEFDPQMVESRDNRTVRVVMDRNIDEIVEWCEIWNLDVTVKFGLAFNDGDIDGTPVVIEIPLDQMKYVCDDCDEEWEGPYDREAMNEGDNVGPEEHEFRTGHKVWGL